MERPTKEQVENALQWSEEAPLEDWEAPAVLAAELRVLRSAVETALSDLECIYLKCWCFTRAAMDRPECVCASCKVWRALAKGGG